VSRLNVLASVLAAFAYGRDMVDGRRHAVWEHQRRVNQLTAERTRPSVAFKHLDSVEPLRHRRPALYGLATAVIAGIELSRLLRIVLRPLKDTLARLLGLDQ